MAEQAQFQQRGAIVRIKICNFMTYSETEIRPGPNLNMVLGPNGTGKSAIVCCIIVGLAGEVSLTGRGTSPADFVKKDTDWASTYIELYNPKGNNYTVERKIIITNRSRFKIDHKSEWRINGKTCRKVEVQALTKKLNIKVDNLCQFLPQDSVTQFVKMNTCELLLNTLKAAGDNKLVEDHQKLVVLTKEIEEKRIVFKTLEKSVKENEVNVRRLEADVHQLRQREELVREKAICSEKIYYAKYREAQSKHDEAKMHLAILKAELADIKSQSEPLRLAAEQHKQRELKMRQAFDKSTEQANSAYDLTESIKTAIDDCKCECQSEYSKFKEKQSEANKRESSIRLKQQEVDTFEAKLHDLMDIDCTRQIEQAKKELEKLSDERKMLLRRKGELDNTLRNLVTELNDLMQEQEQISRVREKKTFLLKGQHPDTFRVLEWLSKNKDRFQKKIYSPMMCEINVKDAKYNRIIENAVNRQELIAFVCQTSEDLRTFTRSVRDELKISFNVILAPEKKIEQFEEEASRLPDFRELGVKAYLKDLIDAPEPIMRYLCGSFNFHRIPVADGCSERQLQDLLRRSPKFYVGNQLYTVSRSRYDNQSMTVQEPVRDAQLLIYSFDQQSYESCRERYNSKAQLKNKVSKEKEEAIARDDEVTRQWQVLSEKHKSLLNKQGERARLETLLRISLEQLQKLKCEKIDLKMEREKLQKSIEKINLNIADHLKNYSKVFSEIADHKMLSMQNHLMVRVALRNYKLAIKKYTAAQSDTTRWQSAIRRKQDELAALDSQLKAAFTAADKSIKGFKKDGTLSRSTQSKFNTISQNTVEELTYKMEDLIVRIQKIYQDSSNTVLNEFNRLNEELKDKRFRLTELRTSIDEIDATLESIKTDWLPKLQEVIRVININYKDFMRSLRYDGEVRLDYDHEKPNNFDSFGVLILVKYRDNENLIPLSATRQSGGERSVATMIYMLALQAKTSVPFRCVDEINQGMDKENERKVFELLVRTADSSSSQYFLVSPKLLSNLPYSEKMMIHVVFNGKQLGLSWNDL